MEMPSDFHLWIVWMDFGEKSEKLPLNNISFSHQIVLFSAQIERSDNQHFCHLGTAFRYFNELFTNQTGKSELIA